MSCMLYALGTGYPTYPLYPFPVFYFPSSLRFWLCCSLFWRVLSISQKAYRGILCNEFATTVRASVVFYILDENWDTVIDIAEVCMKSGRAAAMAWLNQCIRRNSRRNSPIFVNFCVSMLVLRVERHLHQAWIDLIVNKNFKAARHQPGRGGSQAAAGGLCLHPVGPCAKGVRRRARSSLWSRGSRQPHHRTDEPHRQACHPGHPLAFCVRHYHDPQRGKARCRYVSVVG